jgi:hypothetical protein
MHIHYKINSISKVVWHTTKRFRTLIDNVKPSINTLSNSLGFLSAVWICFTFILECIFTAYNSVLQEQKQIQTTEHGQEE